MIKLVIFDFFGTLYDPRTDALFPETISLLEWLKTKGVKRALFTNSFGWRVAFFPKHDKLFDDTFEVNSKDSNVLASILQKCGAQPNETVVIGDSPAREIAAGKELGTRTIALGEHLDDPLHPGVARLADVQPILAAWLG